MPLPIQLSTRQHQYEYRPDIKPRLIASNFNNLQDHSVALRALEPESVSGQGLYGAPDGRSTYNLGCVVSQENETSTLLRLARVIAECGVEVAWERIGDIAASYKVSHCGRERVFRIHDFYRPEHYTTLADLMMVVADTEVQLGLLCASNIGRALLRQLFSVKDLRGQRISTVSAGKIQETITECHEASPYLVHVSSDHLYISWKTVGWWEVYDLDSLDILLKEALNALPRTAMRPKPPPAWIKKYRPAIRRPASSWYCAIPSPKQSKAALAKSNRDETTLPSIAVAVHSTRPLDGDVHCQSSLPPSIAIQRACEQAQMTLNDGPAGFVYHPTEHLPPATSCSLRAKKSKCRRLWRKLMCI